MRTPDELRAEIDQSARPYKPKANGHDTKGKPALDPVVAMPVPEFLTLKIQPREMMVDPIIPTQGLVMLYAPRGIGKTFVALSIAMAAARGGRLFEWSAPVGRPVLFVDGEMPAATMQERLRCMVGGDAPLLDHFDILCADRRTDPMPNLASEEGQAAIDALVKPGHLLVLDNLSSLVSGQENEASDWQSVQDWLLRLRRRHVSVLLVHHAGKNGEQRGTSRREDILDSIVALRRPSDYQPSQGARFEVHIEKARGVVGEKLNPFEAQMEVRDGRQEWTWKPLEEVIYERVVEMSNSAMSIRDIAEELKISKSWAGKLQQRGVSDGRITPRKKGRPSGGGGGGDQGTMWGGRGAPND